MYECIPRRPAAAVQGEAGDGPDGLRSPALYQRMVRAFGRVWVGNRGEPFRWQPTAGPGGAARIRIVHSGEIYRFRCPHCGDTRTPGRGWASHYFGQADPLAGAPMFHLVGCFNADCFREPGRRDEFVLRILGVLGPACPLPPCPPGEVGPARRGPASLPGRTVSLLDLDPDHPAKAYLRGRGFDPDELAARYGLGYCLDAEEHEGYAIGKLIIPIRDEGRLVGWQARKLREGGPGQKYLNSRGLRKGMIYGHDDAADGRLAVLVEGVPSVWALGPPAMAALGSSLSPAQCERLAPIGARGGLAVVLFDPGAEDRAEKAAGALAPSFEGRVVVAHLPAEVQPEDLRRPDPSKLDPAELRREVGWAIIAGAIAAAGYRPGDYGFGSRP